MELYYGKKDTEGNLVLQEDENHHLLKVRRAEPGERIAVTDGEGSLFTAVITSIAKHDCCFRIVEEKKEQKIGSRLHLAIAPTKNIDRMEWLVEKAAEIGIDEITFITCRRSERKEIRRDRIQKIALGAMKQSARLFLPVINEMIPFSEFIKSEHASQKFICAMNAENKFENKYIKYHDLTVMVGPEGDFHPDEVAAAIENGFIGTSLGSMRLRTETAGLMTCMMFNFINNFES